MNLKTGKILILLFLTVAVLTAAVSVVHRMQGSGGPGTERSSDAESSESFAVIGTATQAEETESRPPETEPSSSDAPEIRFPVLFRAEDGVRVCLYENGTCGEEAGLVYSDASDGTVTFRLKADVGLEPVIRSCVGSCGLPETLGGDIYRIGSIEGPIVVNVGADYCADWEQLSPEAYCSYLDVLHACEEAGTEVPSELIPPEREEILENCSSFLDENGLLTLSWQLAEGAFLRSLRLEVFDKDSDHPVFYAQDADAQSFSLQLVPGERYTFVLRPFGTEGGGKTLRLSQMYLPEAKEIRMPVLTLDTEGGRWPSCDVLQAPEGAWGVGITDSDYIGSRVRLASETGELLFDSAAGKTPEAEYDGARVRVRGNTSGVGEFPSYKIHLDKAADLLGAFAERENGTVYEDKEWLLLSCGSVLNQAVMAAVAQAVEMEYVPAFTYVQLYMNGDYRGLYVLIESVKQGNGSGDDRSRVAVDDSGYIVELDAYWWNEDYSFPGVVRELNPLRYTVRFPETAFLQEDAPELAYIRDWVVDFETALHGDSAYSFLNYISLESFARWLLAHDILGTADGGGSNIFLTKADSTANTLLKMGPLWDADSVCTSQPKRFSAQHGANYTFFGDLNGKSIFTKCYRELYAQYADKILPALRKTFDAMDGEAYSQAVSYHAERQGGEAKDYAAQTAYYYSWFETHLKWMQKHI